MELRVVGRVLYGHWWWVALVIMCAMIMASCGSVPRTDAPCRNDFRNGTDGVLSDAELASAWSRAQHLIADGGWVINALSCSNPNIKCITHAPEPKALTIAPQCLSVKGIHGKVEMENSLGEKLGFDEGDR